MKKLSLLLLCFICATISAQDILKTELFDVDVVMKYQSEIELTTAQKESIKKVHQTHISNFNNAKWDLDAEMATLNEKLTTTKINEKAALEQMKVISDLENQLKMIRLEMLIKIKNQLSEKQQTKLKELRTDSDLLPATFVTSINDGQKIKLQVSKSVDRKTEPLYIIVDKIGEVEVNKNKFGKLDPNKIESVSVLKGKSATTIYGKRGENGVVVVKLKQKK